jgi:hypothetical protein
MRTLVCLAALAALAVPSLARAGDVAMRVQNVPLGPRALSSLERPMRFNMLGARWVGTGAVSYRVHRLHGTWTTWRASDADAKTGVWHDGGLDWTGAADGVQFRKTGAVRRLRAYELWSRVTETPLRHTSAAGEPAIVPRVDWEADERIVRAKPLVAPVLKLAVVHHTAGTNSYTPAQSAAIVRGIEEYHVRGNGWNDIGYNFLVDRFGNVYEGRAGGLERNVIGAHAEGFNTGTVGVALIGNYSSATPPKAQQDALVKLLAWRLDVAHVDPLSTVVYTSGGNAKFRSGKLVTLRAISGHRDTGPSECPGNGTYRLLPALAKRVSLTGLPKLYGPTMAGTLGGPVVFKSRLSSSLPWTVTIVDSSGRMVASGKGTGSLVSWTWSSQKAARGLYTWTIAAPGARPVVGTLGAGTVAPPKKLSLTNLAVAPSVTPGSLVSASFTLGADANVTAQLYDAAGAPVLAPADEGRAAGQNTLPIDTSSLPDGRYRLAVTATSGTTAITKTADLVVDRTVSGLTASVPAISPNGDGVNDSVSLTFTLAQQVPVRLDIVQAGVSVATPFQGVLDAGPHTLAWDGVVNGAPLVDGKVTLTLTVADALGDVPIAMPLTIDTVAPTLTVVDPTRLTFAVDEAATVTVLVNGRVRIVRQVARGRFTVPYEGGAVTSFSAQAQDAAGNFSQLLAG